VVGVPVGAVMQHAMFGQLLWDFTMPFTVIGPALVGISVAAVLAAMWPARRAAGTNMLEAITGK
jgi:putative ABC transport system permease protein